MITKLLKICERTHKSSINIRLAAAEAFTSATIGGVLCSFTSPLRAWHTFCPDTIFVGLTAQECAENQKTNCGCVFREFCRD